MQRADRNLVRSVAQHVQSAEAHLVDGDPHTALADLDLAFLIGQDDPVVRLLRGRTLSMLGRGDAALAELNAALALDPTMADAWLERGTLHLDSSNWSPAESDCSRALELDGTLARAWRSRGIARYKLGSMAEAAEDLNRSLTGDPEDSSAHYWQGMALRDAGHNRNAVAAFDAAIRINDRYVEAYVARGKAHSNLGDMAAARSDWAIAARMLHHSH